MSTSQTQNQIRAPLAVIGLGASAGGLAAFRELLGLLKGGDRLAFILVAHLAPDHDSLLAELLDKASNLRVTKVTEPLPLEGGRIYVIPPNRSLAIEDDSVVPIDTSSEHRFHPIDFLFRSMASELSEKAVGVVLSGTGSDGSLGLRAIKEHGGIALVQHPDTADYDGMPRSALQYTEVDRELGLRQLAEFLDNLPQRLGQVQTDLQEERFLEAIFRRVRAACGFDFSGYKGSTLLRRAARRMVVTETDSYAEYLAILDSDGREPRLLMREFLISVTSFFRDAAVFDALKSVLAGQVRGTEELRVWVPGCATGEEAYSLLMLLDNLRDVEGREFELQMFATDVDSRSLATARKGLYPRNVASEIPDPYLQKYFQIKESEVLVSPALRSMCLFSEHNLLVDPPFSKLDFISCRNLLIYLDKSSQEQALKFFHYALEAGGLLLLGSSEGVAEHKDLFEPIDSKYRIFRSLPKKLSREAAWSGTPSFTRRSEKKLRRARLSRDVRMDNVRRGLECLDATVVVCDSDSGILDSFGQPDRFLKFRPGPAQEELLKLASHELLPHLRAAHFQLRRDGKEVVVPSIPMDVEGERKWVRLIVAPLDPSIDFHSGEGDYLVVLEEREPSEQEPEDKVPVQSETLRLQEELDATRLQLRTTVEELELHIEELRSTNEELVSMNEELQSSNEELQLSQEELQSVNEELSAVNSEVREKNEALDVALADLQNLFRGTPHPTIFLDNDFLIRQFTPTSDQVFGLIPTDIGRPIDDIRCRVKGLNVIETCVQVLSTLESHESIVIQDDGDKVFQFRVFPYRTRENSVAGLVLTFLEVTNLHDVTQTAKRREREQSSVARLGLQALEAADTRKLLAKTAEEVKRTLDCYAVTVFRFYPEEGLLLNLAHFGWSDGGPTELRVKEDSQAGLALSLKQPHIFQSNGERGDTAWFSSRGIRSGIYCAVGEGDMPYGLIACYSREKERFSEDDARYLRSVSSLIASAQIRLEAQALARLEHETARIISRCDDFEEAASGVLEVFAEHLRVAVCELWTPNESGDNLTCRFYQLADEISVDQWRDSLSPELTFRKGEGLVGFVWSQGKPHTTPFLEKSDFYKRRTQAEVLGLKSGLALPLSRTGETVGVLALFSQRRVPFADRLQRTLNAVGLALSDFHRRSEAERQAQLEEEKFRNLADSAPVLVWITNGEGRWEWLNRRWEPLTGQEMKSLLSQSWELWMHPEDFPEFAAHLESSQSQGGSFNFEGRLKNEKGSYRWFMFRGVARGDGAGVLGTATDITVQHEARQRVMESERRLFRALKSVPFPLAIVDSRGHFPLINDAALARTGYTQSELSDTAGWCERVFRSRLPNEEEFQRLFGQKNGVTHLGQFPIYHRENGKRIWDFHSSPLRLSKNGDSPAVIIVAYDVTGQEKARTELERASRHKDEFLAILGHELRNPLAVVRNGVNLIQASDDYDAWEESVELIDRQSRQMVNLIDGLLDLSRIARGKIKLDFQPLEITTLVKELVQDRKVNFEEAGLALRSYLPEEEVWSTGDRTRLCQILDNLLTNSLKFTSPGGEVEVALDVTSEEQFEVSVSDTGQGMSPELAAVIFEPFSQGDEGQKSDGLGLGLSLVKSLTEMHGGKVELFSEGEGKGCEITLTLPHHERPSEFSTGHESAEIPPLNILCVEDLMDVAKGQCNLLRQAGHTVKHVADGVSALNALGEEIPDLILCDLGLPGELDGLALARRLRRDPRYGEVTLVAVSGYGTRSDKERSRDAGFDAHINKPLDLDNLNKVLQDSRKQGVGNITVPSDSFYSVLLVDDQPLVRQSTKLILEKNGFQVFTAGTGREAGEILSAEKIHATIFDLNLPDGKGPEFFQQFKAEVDPTLLGVTITGEEIDEYSGLQKEGLVESLTKPVSEKRLLQALRKIALRKAAEA